MTADDIERLCATCLPSFAGEIRALLTRAERAEAALADMVRQFASWSNKAGGYTTGGLSALEDAFEVLGWGDPHPAPAAACDEPGCQRQADCGWPSPAGYRHTCGEHWQRRPRPDPTRPGAMLP